MKIVGVHCNIWGNPDIGEGTKIGSYVEIGRDVVIGKKCKIQSFVYIPPGVIIGDNVFIGPRVTFTNDKHPPSGRTGWQMTHVGDCASIGAGAIILPGIYIAKGAIIGAGAVVTRNVKEHGLVVGNPAR